jgi:hypothetical protein
VEIEDVAATVALTAEGDQACCRRGTFDCHPTVFREALQGTFVLLAQCI